MILLISNSTNWLWLAIAAFVLLIGVSVLVYAITRAESYDPEQSPNQPGKEPVTFQDIVDSERPYYQYS